MGIESIRRKHRSRLVVNVFRYKYFRLPNDQELSAWVQFLLTGNALTELFQALGGAVHSEGNIVPQTESPTTSRPVAPNGTVDTRAHIATNQQQQSDALKKLSPRARDIYFQLKGAVAIHARLIE